ncbi:MAG: hypothetical protein MUF42_06015 [Cytophagaceae bacterium]|nr:hypothetical protein [Cytophagaceae bacterium]
MQSFVRSSFSFIKQLLVESITTALSLYKIMIPISLAVALAEYLGLIPWLSRPLAMPMQLIGLPPEAGIVWASTMLTNIYGGMITFYNLHLGWMSQAQVSVICCLMLVAHTLPVELQVARQAGIRWWTMFVFRFSFALLTGALLSALFSILHVGASKVETVPILASHQAQTWQDWCLTELLRYVQVFFVVTALLLVMKVLKKTGFISLLAKALQPLLRLLRMNAETIPILLVGLSLGILYGGALMNQEISKGNISPRQVLYSFLLMGLCHSLIEDSLLMLSMGASWIGVFPFRILMALGITYLIIRYLNTWPDEKLQRYFMIPKKPQVS